MSVRILRCCRIEIFSDAECFYVLFMYPVFKEKLNFNYDKYNTMKRKIFVPLLFLLLLVCLQPCNAQSQHIDLAGVWNVSLDSVEGCHEITLPGSTDEVHLGKKHVPGTNLYTGDPETWQLARKYVFIGSAEYSRNVDIPKDWVGRRVVLSLERCMWQTKLWINGNFVGEDHSLCTPHRYDVTRYIKAGCNEIRMLINNSPYVNLGSWSHGYAPGIQTIWNGAIGKLCLEALDEISVENLQCYPSFKDKSLQVRGSIINIGHKSRNGKLKFNVIDPQGRTLLSKTETVKACEDTATFNAVLQFEDSLQPWNEFTPNIYNLVVDYKFGPNKGSADAAFGFRDLVSEGGRLMLNNSILFLRGEHDPGSFPLTGYPSMSKDEWLKIFRVGKEYGLNHWRFHSWCPPEAAFAAADELGIYLQPELPLFSQKWEKTLMGQDALRDEFLFTELKRVLDAYGNHPSFMLMCMGNELKGDTSVLKSWVEYGKNYDGRHLYASSANLEAFGLYLPLSGDQFQVAHAARIGGRRLERRMGGYFNTEKPNTINDYSYTLREPYNKCPVITHELGQWDIYPDFSAIEKCTGVLAPRNFEIFKESLCQKGMADMAKPFLHASGKLASILYKEEIERVLRTPGMSGFQMLDLRDYPAQGSALVGLLDVFWDSKGLIAPEVFRQSCNDVTLLLKMPKRTWINTEDFDAEVVLPNYGNKSLNNVDVLWNVSCNGNTVYSGKLSRTTATQGEVSSCGKITFPLTRFDRAVKLEIALKLEGVAVSNKYDIWVYPQHVDEVVGDVIIAENADAELLKKIKNGAKVLLVPKKIKDSERMTFSNPFWSTLMFDYQPKTMGLLCNPEHPVFKDFPTEGYTNWQWWELVASASAVRLNSTPASYRPILQVIDHPVRNDKLGAILETRIGKGRLLICTLDILSNPEKRVVARQLKYSILRYMNSSDFHPQEIDGIEELFFSKSFGGDVRTVKGLFKENLENPASNMVDGKIETFCKIPAASKTSCILIELKSARYITGCRLPVAAEGIRGFKVYVTDDKAKLGDAVIYGSGRKSEYPAKQWDNGFTVQKGKKGKYVFIEIEKIQETEARVYEFELLYGD